jgi:hypothetical protein
MYSIFDIPYRPTCLPRHIYFILWGGRIEWMDGWAWMLAVAVFVPYLLPCLLTMSLPCPSIVIINSNLSSSSISQVLSRLQDSWLSIHPQRPSWSSLSRLTNSSQTLQYCSTSCPYSFWVCISIEPIILFVLKYVFWAWEWYPCVLWYRELPLRSQ